MRPGLIRDARTHDPIGERRSRRARLRVLVWVLGISVVVGAAMWVALWSPLVAVSAIDAGALPADIAVRVQGIINAATSRRALGWIPVGRNMMLFDASAMTATIASQLPILENVSVVKKYPNTIIVSGAPRTPVGVWCRANDECQYWDLTGARWGDALPSVGPLLLMVRDNRSEDEANPALVSGILQVAAGLPKVGLAARMVTLPDAEPGGARIVTTAGYDLLVDGQGDIADQLNTLTVFLADRAKDPNFHPLYIDLRTPGRVYYK